MSGPSSVYVSSGCTLNIGPGMISEDPLLVDPSDDDFHLTYDSPCRNTGYKSGIPPELLYDFEGDPRISDDAVEIGADEFHNHLYCTGDISPGSTIIVKVIGTPGTSPVVLGLGSGVQDPPMPSQYGDIYLTMPVLWQQDIGTIQSNGVLEVSGLVPSYWQSGEQYPFQALIGPLGNPSSELTNLMLLISE